MIYTVITPQEEVKEIELGGCGNDSIIELISRKEIYNAPPARDAMASIVKTVKYRTLHWESFNFLIPEDWEVRMYTARMLLGVSLDLSAENVAVGDLYEQINKKVDQEGATLIGAKTSYLRDNTEIEVRAIGYIKK